MVVSVASNFGWGRVNISQLRAFVTVVDRGSFSEAARDLGVSQPAVTMQVQSLESALGVLLLDRRYRRVDLTEAGHAVLPHARRVLDQLEQARIDLEQLSGTITGRLTIAASTTPGVYLVPRLLGAFTDAYPEVAVSVVVTDTAQVVDAVESGSAQIGITGATVRAARVAFEKLGHDELLLIASRKPLSRGARIPLSELCEERGAARVGLGHSADLRDAARRPRSRPGGTPRRRRAGHGRGDRQRGRGRVSASRS